MAAAAAQSDRGLKGRASLEVDRVAGESTVTSSYSTSPLKLLTPRSRGPSVWAYMSSFGGGLVAGDQTHLELRVGRDACCFLGTQAWTKVYRNASNLPSSHETRGRVETGATLVFAPDPIQAFAGSTYSQVQRFDLAVDASLVLVDWCTAGRIARGERWDANYFHTRNEVFVDGKRVFHDALTLCPEDGALTNPHRLGRFNCLATLFLIGREVKVLTAQLLDQVGNRAVTRRADWIGSASPIGTGVVYRLAGAHFESVARELHSQVASLGNLLADDPWSRKW